MNHKISLSESTKYFNSKILLFGEYTVTLGSEALAVPYNGYKGGFSFLSSSQYITEILLKLYNYCHLNQLGVYYDLTRFKVDIDNGLTFDADVPFGYGLGSSGVLIAAFYDRYGIKEDASLAAIKDVLAKAESCFHGVSSGMDPLVSYLDSPVYFSNSGCIALNEAPLDLSNFFMLDTGISRKTTDYVEIFKIKCVEKAFKNVLEELKKLNTQAISTLFANDFLNNGAVVRKISELQLEAFSEMIPEAYLHLWEKGLQTDEYYLKLCGAGGGGMILGWSISKDKIQHLEAVFLNTNNKTT